MFESSTTFFKATQIKRVESDLHSLINIESIDNPIWIRLFPDDPIGIKQDVEAFDFMF